jgi:flagellar FliL protein
MKRKRKGGEGEAAGKSGRGNIVPAVVVAVGLLGAGYFVAGRGDAPTAAAEEAPAEAGEAGEASEAEEEGPVVPVEPVTVNLSDGHYLKVGIALQLAVDPEGGGGHGSGEAMTEGETAKALDHAIDLFGRHSMDELSDPARRAEVKEQLAAAVREAYHGHVTDLYFTSFVMQ